MPSGPRFELGKQRCAAMVCGAMQRYGMAKEQERSGRWFIPAQATPASFRALQCKGGTSRAIKALYGVLIAFGGHSNGEVSPEKEVKS